ncbi:MAG TPA: class I SAM-dependent methyltransferase [Chitinophagales bacterium]|nr:class I SAM-dependent methyltransferase [Chitinophagales bacterium]
MKLHRNLCNAVIAGLKDILLDKKQADVTVSNLLQSNKSWGVRDRNFIADNIYSIVRYKRLYEFCMGDELFGEVSLWKLFGTKLILDGADLPDWEHINELNRDETLKRFEEAKTIRKIRESIPDWFDQLGVKEMGAEVWEKEIAALNTQAQFSIRINTLKTSPHILKRLFTDEGIEFAEVAEAPDALLIKGKRNFRNHTAYKSGLFEIQDISSQLVAPFAEPGTGMNVIDGCAGAGGKSLHLSALMQNTGEILSVDIHQNKLDELERRANRDGCKNIKTMHADKLTGHYRGLLQSFADRILVDVPCSGTGVLRRKPDAKWSLTPKFLGELKEAQAQILSEYAPMLKTGGLLVYSTCSILPSENELQVKAFLERHSNFELIEDKRISPADTGFDGFYMAKMRKV